PELLEADAVFLRLAVAVEAEAGDKLLGKRATHALADQHIFAQERHAARIGRARLAIALDTHVAGSDADDVARLVIQNFGAGEARIDFDAQRFGAPGQPAADIAERHDV